MIPAQPNEPAALDAPRRRFRKLRIAWSAGCGIACALLIVLWRASYHSHATTEPYAISDTSDLTIEFYHGQVALILSPLLPPNTLPLFLHDYPVQNENRLPGIAGFASLRVPRVGDVTMAPVWCALTPSQPPNLDQFDEAANTLLSTFRRCRSCVA
jgi:hypothetical protein